MRMRRCRVPVAFCVVPLNVPLPVAFHLAGRPLAVSAHCATTATTLLPFDLVAEPSYLGFSASSRSILALQQRHLALATLAA